MDVMVWTIWVIGEKGEGGRGWCVCVWKGGEGEEDKWPNKCSGGKK